MQARLLQRRPEPGRGDGCSCFCGTQRGANGDGLVVSELLCAPRFSTLPKSDRRLIVAAWRDVAVLSGSGGGPESRE